LVSGGSTAGQVHTIPDVRYPSWFNQKWLVGIQIESEPGLLALAVRDEGAYTRWTAFNIGISGGLRLYNPYNDTVIEAVSDGSLQFRPLDRNNNNQVILQTV
jgi:hypothetical protein